MKKIYKSVSVLFAVCFLSLQGFATNHIITVEDFSFTPRNLAVFVGDTITWNWVSGFHTTTSDNIPLGAADWDVAIEPGLQSFIYVVTVEGNYQYHCTPHQSMGMTASFTATGTTDINEAATPALNFNVWQSSFDKSINMLFNKGINGSVDFSLLDLSGKVVYTNKINSIEKGSHLKFLTPALPVGIYLAEIRANSNREVKRIILN